ncbi:TRAP transporter fused permease subunit [Bacillus timonensis]|uniref:TRAP transporter fused permease subunit n=1 Tax=Bacillus timonensis TaxID=1033734 RepID=A0A4S3PLJ7_9BACI|nr:TRAP transporter fused permease subunit [Bacillus timonensis]THE09915.1 TRAP transporter fused permease subunit [Bacillus timonensis]
MNAGNPGKKSIMERFISIAGLAKPRNLIGMSSHIYVVIAIMFSLLFLYVSGPSFLGNVPIQYQRGLYAMLIAIMVFFKFPFSKKSPMDRVSFLDILMIGLSIFVFGYWILNFDELLLRVGNLHNYEYYIAAAAMLICLEVSRRVLGPIFPMVGIGVVLYSLFGDAEWITHLLRTKGFSWQYIAGYSYSLEGIFGSILYIIATFVTLFVIFGALMESLGAGAFFIGLPYALTSGLVGGPAKTAVVASGLFGSISGSATANTAATGAFTIPLMIKSGYRREVAGAIEPAASTGGMFMPPVMGAGAFIMADMLGVPYVEIVKVGFVPAIIYFLSVYMIVHYYAKAHNIRPLSKEERPDVMTILKDGFHFLIPLILLIVLLFNGISAQRSIYWTIISMIGITLVVRLLKRNEKSVKEVTNGFFKDIIVGLKGGADGSLTIGSVAGATGIVVAGVMLTGLGFSFTTGIMSLSGGSLIIAILMAFFAAYILGMGLTVTAAYILIAVLAAPAIVEFGVPAIAVHFLLFWYSQTSNVSPPVSLAAFVGAGIAEANPYKCGINALKFSAFILIMPLMFIYSEILMPNGLNFNAIWAMFGATMATIPYAAFIIGYFNGKLNLPLRLIMLVTTGLFFIPSVFTTIVALIITVAMFLYQKKYNGPINLESEKSDFKMV